MPRSVVRDRLFWQVSFQTVAINMFLGGFGPSQGLLRVDQGTTGAQAGLHGTAMGIAAIVAGAFNSRLAHRYGRVKLSWLGLALFCLGLSAFILFPTYPTTLLSILIAGFGTSTVVNNGLTLLNHHAGDKAALTISQANAVASVGFIAGTLIIGTIATNYPDKWRLGLFLIVPLSLFIYLFIRDKNYIDVVFEEGRRQSGKMSLKFWISWIGFIACIGSEFATSFWAASLFKDRVGGSAGVATTIMFAYGIGMALGRWYMGHILFNFKLDQQLLTVIGIQFVGFAIFWFSHIFVVSIIGLFLIGLGLSTQFALASLRLIYLSHGRPDQAIGLSSLAAGIAIALAPFALGLLDDAFGISRAYIMVPILIAIAFIVVLAIPTHVSQKKVHEAEGILE
ncbi:MAG: MFS transporter [Candidatus Planktophila sp.]